MKLTILTIIAILFSSCIEIVEEITFNKDGSGKVTYSVDFTHFYDYDTTMSEKEKEREYAHGLKNIGEKNERLIDKLSKTGGIFNVKDKTDYKVFMPIYILSLKM